MLRRRRDPLARVRPGDAPARWRHAVEAALGHRAQYERLRSGLRDGPLLTRVVELGTHVDAGVLAVWELVERGGVAERTLATIDADRATAELKEARRRLASAGDAAEPPNDLAAHVAALAARHASMQRIRNAVEDLEAQLHTLDVRLGAVVALVAELAVGVADDATVDRALGDLDRAVEELDLTRRSLDELAS